MPVIAQAAKKLRRDVHRTSINEAVRRRVDKAVKLARKHPTAKSVSSAFRELDKAAKRHLVHANTVSRTKSRLAKLLKK
jgi:small subunit ribosomal protein S20